ncbi:HAD superfamily [Forsythia ovata]|uniref:Inositol oxygenase n=1 Tax=Forsythia ovata TaxID=205694 RepID=A0ABD1WZK0_9LAMI
MGIWECCELLNNIVDESDPDLDEPQIKHLLQTAEAIRKDYPDEDWLHLTGLIHGDTFPVGCAFDESIVHHKYFKENPDFNNPKYNNKYEGCGLEKVLMSWGHDDYMLIVVFLFLATVSATCHENCFIKQVVEQIHLLRPRSGAAGYRLEVANCQSWRLAVETNNIRNWKMVPGECENYVGHYMLGKQYRDDCEIVADLAIEYAKSLTLAGDGKDIWVFDIDETTLSNLPYYARSDVLFGAIPYNSTLFNEWVAEGTAPPVPASLRLYRTLLPLGFKIVFLTGSSQRLKASRASNLKAAGYHTWEKLILRGEADEGTAMVYKSNKRTELVNSGYRILGNMGDQWSDILGENSGNRTFKVPDPMYYIA